MYRLRAEHQNGQSGGRSDPLQQATSVKQPGGQFALRPAPELTACLHWKQTALANPKYLPHRPPRDADHLEPTLAAELTESSRRARAHPCKDVDVQSQILVKCRYFSFRVQRRRERRRRRRRPPDCPSDSRRLSCGV